MYVTQSVCYNLAKIRTFDWMPFVRTRLVVKNHRERMNRLKIAVYPGSFDPITNGHIDILERSSLLFDKIIVAVVHNPTKNALFSPEERAQFITESTRHIKNIEVDCFDGLLAQYMKQKGSDIIIRGLRSITDFEYESHMSMMNRHLLPHVDTIFIMSDIRYIYISSSSVKEVAMLGGDVTCMVPALVKEALRQKYRLKKQNG